MAQSWELIMGLEVHCQLQTVRKMFCDCTNDDQAAPNTHICPICLGYPGTLPKVNWDAIALAVRGALALGCRVCPESEFARKHYFYPDLPKGYQITQYRYPLAQDGCVWIGTPMQEGFERRIRVVRLHVEEDAAKNVHAAHGSGVNFNRAGVPLVEIVSEPFSGESWHAAQYLRHLHWILLDIGITKGSLEDGHLRCDVNVSVRPKGSQELRTRVEVKNLNSFRFIEKAIAYERDRHIALYDKGESPDQETRLFDSKRGITLALRSKEEAMDYRYFPDPDLPPLVLDAQWIAKQRQESTILNRKHRLMSLWGADEKQACTIVADAALLHLVEESISAGAPPKKVMDWVLTTVLEHRKENALPVRMSQLVALIQLVESHVIHTQAAKEVFRRMAYTDRMPDKIVEEQGLAMHHHTEDTLKSVIAEVVAQNPDEWKRFCQGDHKLKSFFMGQVMRKAGGKIDPTLATQCLEDMQKEGAHP